MPLAKCTHEKTKAACIICSPNNFCPCGRLKRQCKDCNGSNVCFIHGTVRRLKSDCLECHPEKTCEHGKLKRKCYKCNEHLRCECGKLKYNCYKHSPGTRFCEHNKFRSQCKTCIIASVAPATALPARLPAEEDEVEIPPGFSSGKCPPGRECERDISGYKLCTHGRRLYNCHICYDKAAERREAKIAASLAKRAARQAEEAPIKDILDSIRADVKNGFTGASIKAKYGPILATRRAREGHLEPGRAPQPVVSPSRASQ